MRIDKLNLINFGKFENRQIEFTSGINIIYGLNESGKSTAHSFINGMFYGFLRPYVNRALYTYDHEKYDPWYSSEYKGSLELNKNEEDYIIERNFSKGKEYAKIYFKNTGEEITEDIDTGNSGRILQPGYEFFGFNDVVFNNTISIKQLSNKTDEALAKEVKDKLVNISTSLDDGISIKESIDSIDDKIRDIGSERAYTSPLGNSLKEVEELEVKIRELKDKTKTYKSVLLEKNKIENKTRDKKNKINSLENIKNNVLLKNKKEVYEKAIRLENEIEKLEIEMNNLSSYSKLSMDEYTMLIESTKNREEYENRLADIEKELKEEQDNIDGIKNNINEQVKFDKNLPYDYEEIEKINFKIAKISELLKENDIRFLKLDQNESKKQKTTYFIISMILALLSAIIIGSIFITSQKIQLIGLLIFVPIGAYYYNKFKKAEGLLNRVEKYMEDVSKKQSDLLVEKEKLEKEKLEILEKYDTQDEFEIKKIYDSIALHHLRKEDHKQALSNITQRNISLTNNKIKYSEKLKEEEIIIDEILNRNNYKTILEFKEGLGKKAAYENKVSEYKSKKEILENLLENTTKDELKSQILKIEDKIISPIQNINLDLSYIEEDIVENTQEYRKYELEEKEIDEKIKVLESHNKELLEVEEKLSFNKKKINEMTDKLESLNLAKDTIDRLSKEIHREFAPVINKYVSEIISDITDGKYTEVSIKDNLDIKVQNPDTNELIDFENLSGGTIDQVYFALRYGVSMASNETDLPLILDDCFIQYDDLRLENILKLIAKESKNRQILLFTCQNREKEILDKMNEKYNYIKI